MKKLVILLSSSAMLFLLGSVFSINHAQNQKLSESVVASRCENAQSYLNKDLRERDLRARVDRVRAYEYVYQELNALTLRLEKNEQYSAQNMRDKMAIFQGKINQLKTSYEQYDSSRDNLAKLSECASNPQKFSELLSLMRGERKKVEQQTATIRNFLATTMSNQLEDTYDNFLKTSASGGLR